jgi:hypothetical protein
VFVQDPAEVLMRWVATEQARRSGSAGSSRSLVAKEPVSFGARMVMWASSALCAGSEPVTATATTP